MTRARNTLTQKLWDDAGVVDVVPEDPPDDFQGPDGTLPVKGPNGRFDRDHLALLGGWE